MGQGHLRKSGRRVINSVIGVYPSIWARINVLTGENVGWLAMYECMCG
jgi:hypothetical protein